MGQAASLGLTQQDVEEVIAYCDGAWKQEEIEGLYKRFRSLDRGHKGYISGDEFLDIPELSLNPIASRLVSALFSCMREQAMHCILKFFMPPPLKVRIYESVNFREFTKLLAAFSPRASRNIKLEYMFLVYDVDGDGESTFCYCHILEDSSQDALAER